MSMKIDYDMIVYNWSRAKIVIHAKVNDFALVMLFFIAIWLL